MPAFSRQSRDGHDERQLGGREDGEGGSLPGIENAPVEENRGVPRTTTKRPRKSGSLSNALLLPRASRSKFIPLVTKKKGNEEAEPHCRQLRVDTELVSLESGARDHPGDEAAEQDVQSKELASASNPKTSTTTTRTASWLLDSERPLEHGPAWPREPNGGKRHQERESHEGDQDHRLVQRV